MASTPNVLFVFSDQHRGQALGCAGNDQVHTPTMDRLASEGIHFPNAYTANPVCGPARASILTGRYPHANRVLYNFLGLPVTERSIGTCFREAGYTTGYIGKWHLDSTEANPGFVPPGERRHGFDSWNGFNRGHDHHHGHPTVESEGNVTWEEGYQPTVQTDLAIDFLEAQGSDPFFLMLSWGPPHTPFNAPDSVSDRYSEEVALRPNVPEEIADEVRAELVEYYGMITSLDDELDRLLQALEATGYAENTIVCYTADHGEMLGSLGKQRKQLPFEESINIPLLLRYPGTIEAGRTSQAVVNTVDYLPTLLGLCDLDQPERLHGRDVSDHLLDQTVAGPTQTYIEGQLATPDAWRAIRTEEYLLAVDRDLEVQYLYDLGSDPYQQTNLANQSRRKLQEELFQALVDAAYEYDDRVLMSTDIRQRTPIKSDLDQRTDRPV